MRAITIGCVLVFAVSASACASSNRVSAVGTSSHPSKAVSAGHTSTSVTCGVFGHQHLIVRRGAAETVGCIRVGQPVVVRFASTRDFCWIAPTSRNDSVAKIVSSRRLPDGRLLLHVRGVSVGSARILAISSPCGPNSSGAPDRPGRLRLVVRSG